MSMFCGIDLDKEVSISEEEKEALLGHISNEHINIPDDKALNKKDIEEEYIQVVKENRHLKELLKIYLR
jgi:hypothetical protein